MDTLEQARMQINETDREMVRLFEQRMRAVAQVAEYKRRHGMPVLDRSREEQVVENGAALLQDPDMRPYYEEFIRAAMRVSRNYQNRLLNPETVGYQGVPGAYSYIVLKSLFPEAKERAFATFEELCRALTDGEIGCGLLPFENSYAGEVGETHDLLYRYPLRIVAVWDQEIRHTLLGLPGARLSEIRRVYSHPQALEQCRRFLQSHPFELVPFLNTAAAAKMVSEENDPSVAAIASPQTAELYGLSILAADISTQTGNTTRFVVLDRPEGDPPPVHGDHFALMFTLDHTAGRLAAVIQIIARRGFNMECIRSKPLRDLPWQYYFFAELAGDAASPEGIALLEELRGSCRELKLLGSYTRQAAR